MFKRHQPWSYQKSSVCSIITNQDGGIAEVEVNLSSESRLHLPIHERYFTFSNQDNSSQSSKLHIWTESLAHDDEHNFDFLLLLLS